MVTGHIREMQLRDPRKVRLDYGKRLWHEVFDYNPRIARPEESGDFQIYRPRENGMRPYCTGKTVDRWMWTDYKPHVGELYLQQDELAYSSHLKPDIVIEPNLKGRASPNKDWGRDRWVRLILMMHAAGLRPVQLGQAGTRRLPNAAFIETSSFRLACAVLSRARAAVLHEGGLHHAAAALGVRSVVIYGGYISPNQTGYDMHRNLFTGGKPCGMRIPCRHCHRAMSAITPEMVLAELQTLLG
jgi:ADP-heptose:LPS heptosyltransferase